MKIAKGEDDGNVWPQRQSNNYKAKTTNGFMHQSGGNE